MKLSAESSASYFILIPKRINRLINPSTLVRNASFRVIPLSRRRLFIQRR